MKAFLPEMLEKDHGHIVSVASSAGLVGVNGLADYCASKFAAVGKLSPHSFNMDNGILHLYNNINLCISKNLVPG